MGIRLNTDKAVLIYACSNNIYQLYVTSSPNGGFHAFAQHNIKTAQDVLFEVWASIDGVKHIAINKAPSKPCSHRLEVMLDKIRALELEICLNVNAGPGIAWYRGAVRHYYSHKCT